MFVSAAVVAVFLWRRRRLFRDGAPSTAGTDETGIRVFSWLRGQQGEKTPTVADTEHTPASPEMESVSPALPAIEMADTQVAELMGTNPVPEFPLAPPFPPSPPGHLPSRNQN